MSQREQEDQQQESNNTESQQQQQQQQQQPSSRLRTTSESNRSWPSKFSDLVTLLSGSSSSTRQNSEMEDQAIEEYDCELTCPICQETMKEVFVTQCGHSYCHECITLHISTRPFCPICRSKIVLGQIYPNFQLNKLSQEKFKHIIEDQKRKKDPLQRLEKIKKHNPRAIAVKLAQAFSQSDLTNILNIAMEQRKQQDIDEKLQKSNLLRLFLVKLKLSNEYTIQSLLEENALVIKDLAKMTENVMELATADNQKDETVTRKRKYKEILDDSSSTATSTTATTNDNEGNAVSACTTTSPLTKSKRIEYKTEELGLSLDIDPWFDDLKNLYYKSTVANDLDELSSTLLEINRSKELEVLDTLYYTERNPGSSIVSSIEFDKDQEFFAAGGVTKEIKIYDFSMMANNSNQQQKEEEEEDLEEEDLEEGEDGGDDTGDDNDKYDQQKRRSKKKNKYNKTINNFVLHCPVRKMTCGHKISCLAWSSYIKSQLASSDYEGMIDLWDVMTGQKVRRFTEHQRRAWSVDISAVNPQLIASGSDDNTAKIWSSSSPTGSALYTLELKGNVCCAKFAPNDANLLAVGCADHNVSCFDLRYLKEPIKVFEGHSKAVSYVKWLNNKQLVSASTDSTMKLWDFNSRECVRTFKGHQNEKNFVGLSVNENWISCGSETNTIYTYHKNASAPVIKYKFPAMDDDEDSPSTLFVSSVCWMANTNKIIASNSKGVIKVFQMK